eukprot:CAMPEP_0114993212 /NCGR_PEP_ID=MMETSP0216-20121206/12396_1 /TAXON_ID=223996 /ORGANISM="Protocruzia adherens, Strain Boccale" /LENGTH=619 /DNA_ID=CAMNT_0002356813 /DNA_START=105 /DNA_END=1964 /DNA_ORIENTATION=-
MDSPGKSAVGKAFNPLGLLLFLQGAQLLVYGDQNAIAGLLSHIKESLGINNSLAGLLGSMFMLGFVIANLVFAYLARCFHPTTLIAIGLFIWIAGEVMAGFNENYAMLLAARIITGIGLSPFLSLEPPLVSDIAPLRGKPLWIGLNNVCQTLGYGLGLGYSAANIAVGASYKWTFRLQAVAMAPVFVLTCTPWIRNKFKKAIEINAFMGVDENGDETDEKNPMSSHFEAAVPFRASLRASRAGSYDFRHPEKYAHEHSHYASRFASRLHSQVGSKAPSSHASRRISAHAHGHPNGVGHHEVEDHHISHDEIQTSPERHPDEPSDLKKLLRLPTYFFFNISCFPAFWTAGAFNYFAPNFMQEIFGISSSNANFILAGETIFSGIFAVMLGPYFLDRMLAEKIKTNPEEEYIRRIRCEYAMYLCFIAFLGSFAFGLPGVLIDNVWVFIAGSLMYLCFYNFSAALQTVSTLNSVPQELQNLAMGVNVTTANLGMLISPFVFGVMSDSLGYVFSMGFAFFALLFSVFFSFLGYICSRNPKMSASAAICAYLKRESHEDDPLIQIDHAEIRKAHTFNRENSSMKDIAKGAKGTKNDHYTKMPSDRKTSVRQDSDEKTSINYLEP